MQIDPCGHAADRRHLDMVVCMVRMLIGIRQAMLTVRALREPGVDHMVRVGAQGPVSSGMAIAPLPLLRSVGRVRLAALAWWNGRIPGSLLRLGGCRCLLGKLSLKLCGGALLGREMLSILSAQALFGSELFPTFRADIPLSRKLLPKLLFLALKLKCCVQDREL